MFSDRLYVVTRLIKLLSDQEDSVVYLVSFPQIHFAFFLFDPKNCPTFDYATPYSFRLKDGSTIRN